MPFPEFDIPADENIEPEVERQMIVPRMNVKEGPRQAYIKSEDLEGLTLASPMEKKLWFIISVLERNQDEALVWQRVHNYYLRQIEAMHIRATIERRKFEEKQRGPDAVWIVLKWIGIVGGGGIIAALGTRLLHSLWP